MNNLFDTDNYPDRVPSELVAGSRWGFKRSDVTAAYPTAQYTMLFRLSELASPYADYEFEAGKTGSEHVVEVATAETTGLTQGEYAWQIVVSRDSDSEEVKVDRGFLMLAADFGNRPGETSSWTYQVLVAIRAAIKSGAANSQRSVTVGGRTVEWRSYSEVLGIEQEFARRWANEKAAADRKAGRVQRGRVLARLSA